MRCFFMKNGHIAAVEFLSRDDDPGRIAEAAALFQAKGQGMDGFEVWEGARFVYRSSSLEEVPPTRN
jgi:hypothetical protein